jgi:pimeloyl-ACP methyl ester carboxylesterase
MPIVTVSDGTPIHYLDRGEGPALVLLHGLMMTAEGFWTRNLDALSERCRVIAVDHRSHGLSGKPLGGHSIRKCAEDLKEVLDALDLRDVTLAGVAFGAMVMFEYRRHFGNHRLRRLAVIEAQVRLTNAEGWEHPTFGDFPAEAGAAFVAGCRESREPLIGFLAGAFGTPPEEREMARMQHQAWLTPTAAVIEYIEDMLAADYRMDLSDIDLPTLLLYGRGNNIPLPTELGRWISEQIPDARLECFAESGHSPQYESPERFNQHLSAFACGE